MAVDEGVLASPRQDFGGLLSGSKRQSLSVFGSAERRGHDRHDEWGAFSARLES
jgi:hypothetical protein